jgi:hypothetical protein
MKKLNIIAINDLTALGESCWYVEVIPGGTLCYYVYIVYQGGGRYLVVGVKNVSHKKSLFEKELHLGEGVIIRNTYQVSEDEAKKHFTPVLWKKFVDRVKYRGSKY